MLIKKVEEYYSKEHDLNCAETILYAANDVYKLGLDKNALKMQQVLVGEWALIVCAVL